MNRFWVLSLVISALIIIDQISKGAIQSSMYLGESFPVIDGFFNITYVRNTGAAFGFGGDYHDLVRQILFLALPVGAVIWVFVLLIKSLKGPVMMSIAYALIIAGAIGNLIDRFSLGYVVDMFDFYIGDSHFAVFNVADSCISVAAGLLIIDHLMNLKNKNVSNTDSK
jgi:signal peptidase II